MIFERDAPSPAVHIGRSFPRHGWSVVMNSTHSHATSTLVHERSAARYGIDPVHYARRWKTLCVLSLSLLIIGLDNTILNVALPTLQHEFNATPSNLQWMVDSYLLVFAGLLSCSGRSVTASGASEHSKLASPSSGSPVSAP